MPLFDEILSCSKKVILCQQRQAKARIIGHTPPFATAIEIANQFL
jgi:hypothetical protein